VSGFAVSAARQVKKKAPVFSPAALERLAAHDWPGNVRELRNVVERAVLLASGDVVRPQDIVVGVAGETEPRHPSLDGTLEETAERWRQAGETARIRRALDATGGDKARASEELGVPLRKLAQRMKELGI